MFGKDDFSVWLTQHFIVLLFEDKGRLYAYHNKARMDYRRENLLQVSVNKFAVAAIDRDSAIMDLAYLIAGLGHNYLVPSSPPYVPRSGTH